MTTDQTAASEAARVPYTPSTTMVRLAYIVSTKDDGDPDWTREEAKAKFTRWLEAEKADALAKAGLLREETTGQTSDGSHTFDELYEYRMLYNAHAAKAWAEQGIAVKSWRHSDGEECFGGGWFVVVATLHPHGQVSNHYPAADWDLFHVPEVDRAPEWDGHTPQEAAQRLRAALGTTKGGPR